MSGGNGEPPDDGEDDDVGYGKPPRRTRYKPGQSGNPKGRPKRSFGKHHLPDVILERAREIFIEEGNRKMTLGREGSTIINLTAYRASVRAAHISAVKGSAMAQRTVIQERLRIESEIGEIMRGAFDEMMKYKQECALERQRRRKAGLPAPSFPIDPDHVVLDWETLTVEYRGPLAEQLKRSLKDRIRFRDDWAEDFQFCRERWKEAESIAGLVITLQSQRNHDIMNESLPPRHRATLVGRITDKEIDEVRARSGGEGRPHFDASEDP